MKVTESEKKEIINAAIEAAAKVLTHAFKVCELKDKIESMVINDNNGEEFVLTFYPSASFSTERVKEYASLHNVRLLLPSDEDIKEHSLILRHDAELSADVLMWEDGYTKGAKWMRSKVVDNHSKGNKA